MTAAPPDDHIARVVQQGAVESASALSRLLRLPVGVEGFGVTDLLHLGRAHARVGVTLAFETSGGVPGHLAFVLDEEVATRLVASLTGAHDAELGTAALMALAEVGNIAASAFLNGAAAVVGRTCLPSVPRVSHAPIEQSVKAALPPGHVHVASLSVDGADAVTIAFVAT